MNPSAFVGGFPCGRTARRRVPRLNSSYPGIPVWRDPVWPHWIRRLSIREKLVPSAREMDRSCADALPLRGFRNLDGVRGWRGTLSGFVLVSGIGLMNSHFGQERPEVPLPRRGKCEAWGGALLKHSQQQKDQERARTSVQHSRSESHGDRCHRRDQRRRASPARHHCPSAGSPRLFAPVPSRGITGLAYRSVRAVTSGVGRALGAALARLVPLLGTRNSSSWREAVLGAVNGVLGDYLAMANNPLAIRMRLRREGRSLELERSVLSAAVARPSSRLLVLVHGLCMNDLQWCRRGQDPAEAVTAGPGPIMTARIGRRVSRPMRRQGALG